MPLFTAIHVLISAQMATIRNYLGSNDEHMHRSHQQHVAIIQAIRDADAEKRSCAARTYSSGKGAYWDSSAKKKQLRQKQIKDGPAQGAYRAR